jgi:Tol biopolymer transport system component
MGEVYRARDTRLERTVAIKVLPSSLSPTPEARQRFEREAKMISQLSHPHICVLYDVGREGETEYLVMEYLEGETLADRLAKGPLSLGQTLRFAIQISDALDKAHGQGIVHRDLKPGNVMITATGVKLLDFGLARMLAPDTPSEDLTSAPTTGADLTKEGAVLGTLSYMAPEQLEGKPADARTDIFAFGSLLYEMATGRRAFSGASQASIFSAILRDDPAPITAVVPLCPPALDRLVRTCLSKAPTDRWQSSHDVGLQLRALSEGAITRGAGETPPRVRNRFLPWLVAGVAVALAAAVAAFSVARARHGAPPRTIRFSVPPPANGAFSYFVETTFLAVSPDGSQLAYVVWDPQGGPRIFLRPLSALEARPLAGTDGANSLFFSPDGRSIGFFARDKLKRVELAGGAAVTICDVPPGPHWSGTWGRGGDILFAGITTRTISRVPAAGGAPSDVIRGDLSRGEGRISWPWYLPDGQRFLFTVRYLDGRGELMLVEPGQRPRLIAPIHSAVQYVDPGYLVFAKEGALLAQRFDPGSGRVSGEPISVAEHVRYFLSTGSAAFAASASGTLAYQPHDDVSRLTWLDRAGRELGTIGSPGNYQHLSMARDGRRVLFDRARPGIGTYDVWSLDLERGTETPVTSEPDTEVYSLWLPGGRSVAYSAARGTPPQLFRKDLATGKAEQLLPAGKFQIAQDVSPDGKSLLYAESGEHGAFDLWTIPLSGDGKPVPLLQTPFNKGEARFSPDGRSLAMLTGESGQQEAYVTAYPGPGERIRVSTGGAANPRWSRDGRELLYVSGDRHMMSVPVKTFPLLEIGTPTTLFALGGTDWKAFEVSPDGKRFLAIVPKVVADELPLTAIIHWAPEAR